MTFVVGSLLAACSPHSGGSLPVLPQAGDTQPGAPSGGAPLGTKHIVPLLHKHTASTRRSPLSECTNFPCNPGTPLSGASQIQHTPHYYLVFWGWHNVAPFDPANLAGFTQQFASDLQGTSYMNIVSQYYANGFGYIQNGAEYGGAFWDDGSTPNNPSDAQIETEALTGLHVFGDVSNDANYIVLTPTGHNQANAFQPPPYGFCGWHSYTTYAPSSSIIYSYLPYMGDSGGACGSAQDGTSSTMAHEIAEAMTDPFPYTGWSDQSNGMQNEIGDKCSGDSFSYVTLHSHSYGVQSLWSNADMAAHGGDGCVFTYTPSGPPMTCTPDGMGYCLQQTASNTHAGCTDAPLGTTTYALFKNGTVKNTYTYTVSSYGKDCYERDLWTPADPKSDVGDPNLL